METLEQTMKRTYKWSLNRITDLCSKDIDDVYNAVSIHEEFSEWLHGEHDDHDVFSLAFEPAGIGEGDGDIDAGDNDVDIIKFSLKTAFDNKPQGAMKAIVEAINTHPNSDGFITIFDGVTGQSVHESIDAITAVRAAND